ncbi:acetylglutamate kinase [Thermococcus profundus]|uniref:Isopentenyl phosphate kinase n=1 Tax=Thermococcus profundus TaxID=49899 RepID=A0A2Z2MCU2_THEPR|nr:isopentenyl phosphate kinase [Thermococcus profundus]ASJ02522.1 acetylglutamate kinase [Thermococcus profundus]
MILIKIGGSVFSNKAGEAENFDTETVRRIAGEIAEFYPNEEFIVVHGGGSFGHYHASEHAIRDGLSGNWEADQGKRRGFSLTHQSMLRANARFIDIFLSQNLPAFSVSTSSIFLTERGEIIYADIEVIERLLELDFVPILFGDVAVDVAQGIDILSGDQIMAYLTKMLRPKKAVFLMDVDGIYDGKPGEGTLIQELARDEVPSLLDRLNCTASGTDVTGGICNKLRKAYEMANYSEVWFVNGKIPGRLAGAIRGDGFGTRLR